MSNEFHFKNRRGEDLAARLEMAEDVRGVAIFAHCFTCSKDVVAVTRISRALRQSGISVLRFDFTGLGRSKGTFSDTNFSSNVHDILDAAAYLKEIYKAPSLLIGHSLGGAAVLAAAKQLDDVRGVVTIGAPSDPSHVKKLFQGSLAQISKEGQAEVCLAGRPFTIAQQFVEDLDAQSLPTRIQTLKKPLLIFHSPQDTTVGIDEARRIYELAAHPKSFVSLDGADHLLTQKQDAEYVATVIAAWATRYLITTITHLQ